VKRWKNQDRDRKGAAFGVPTACCLSGKTVANYAVRTTKNRDVFWKTETATLFEGGIFFLFLPRGLGTPGMIQKHILDSRERNT